MARWSDAIKLTDVDLYRGELFSRSGVYELGYVRSAIFSPIYVGKATCLWNRISSYIDETRVHNSAAKMKILSKYHNVWVHYFCCTNYRIVEARLLYRHGIGSEGLYKWNKRYEWAPLNELDM